MAIIEGKWDCSSCGKKGIAGRHKNCPECNDPRDQTLMPSERVYFDADAPEVTDPELLDLAHAGPDWNCGHCDTANRNDSRTCSGCGRAKDGDDTINATTSYLGGKSAEGATFNAPIEPGDRVEDPFDEATRIIEGQDKVPRDMGHRTFDASEVPRSSIHDPADPFDSDYADIRTSDGDIPVLEVIANHKRHLIIGGAVVGALVLLALVIGAIHYAFETKPTDLTITSLNWERRVEVEEYRTLIEEAWDIPARGREISSQHEIRSYRTVHDGWRTVYWTETETYQSGSHVERYACGTRTVDLGNGFASTETEYCDRTVPDYSTRSVPRSREVEVTHEEPVYDIRYTYEIERWKHDSWVQAAGGDTEANRTPYWPEPQGLSSTRRASGVREETYAVTLVSPSERTYIKHIPFSTWDLLTAGQTVVGHVRHSGKLHSVDWPTPVAA